MASVTLREGLRGRTLPGLWAVFLAALLAAAAGSDSPEDRLRGVLSAAGGACHFLLVLSGIVLGALALRREQASRVLLQALSKPLGRGTWLMGKLAGLLLLLGILAGAFAATASAAVALLPGAGGLKVLRVPRQALSGCGAVWRFARPGGPARLEALLAVSESPGTLEAEVSGRRVPLEINARGEAQAPLPEALPAGDLTVRLRLPADIPRDAVRLRILEDSGAYPSLLARAALGDWALAGVLCAAALAGSTVLSGPVALFLALGLAVASHGHPLLCDLETLLANRAAHSGSPPPAAVRILEALRAATPDAERADLCGFLDLCEEPPPGALGKAARAVLPYGAAAALLGLLGMRRLEPGA